jgi:predicted alpha/beta superfamily hydrolase
MRILTSNPCPRFLVAAILLSMPLGLHARAQEAPRLVADDSRDVRDSRGGGGKAFTIRSTILDEVRRLNVTLPPSYASTGAERRYPVIVVLDGEGSLPITAAAVDELTRNGQMPEAIVVAVENTKRLRDLTPPGLSVSGSSLNEGGDRFLDFIERELLPAVDRDLRGAPPRVLIGHSSGGILATYAAATRATYCCILSLDSPTHLGKGWLARKMIARASSPVRPLRYASYESRFGWSDTLWNTLVAAAPAEWKLKRERLADESHESMPMLGTYLGLRTLFRDYSMLKAPVAPTTSILPYYEVIGRNLGGTVVPPRRLLGNVIEDFLIEGRGAEARRVHERQVRDYGADAGGANLLARIADVERRPPPTETVEQLMATPFPSPEAAAAYIGEWVGDVWMNPEEVTPGKPAKRLRIRVVDGKVTGESEDQPEPGVTLKTVWTYMKVTPDGLSFGYMNGMRPRGVLLHEGKLKNGELSGVLRFGGLEFRFEDGSTPPPIYFSFRKVGPVGRPSR